MRSIGIQTPLLTVVENIITVCEKRTPGTRALYEQGRLYLVIGQEANSAIEPLVISTRKPIEPLSGEKLHVTVGFYYEQNGDQMPDPEIIMTDAGFPIRMRQSVCGVLETVALYKEAGETMINLYNKQEILTLARYMARDIRAYGIVKDARARAQIKEVED